MNKVTLPLLVCVTNAQWEICQAMRIGADPDVIEHLMAAMEAVQEIEELVASDDVMSGVHARPYVDRETRRKRARDGVAKGEICNWELAEEELRARAKRIAELAEQLPGGIRVKTQ